MVVDTRTEKYCKDCKHIVIIKDDDQSPYCGHPSSGRSPVTGDPDVRCHWMRQANQPCKPEGLLFEKK